MTKRVLFILPSLGIGGTTVSVRNLISLLEKKGYKCMAMPLNPQGVLRQLYNDVNLLKTPFLIQALSISSWKNEKSLLKKTIIATLRMMRNLNKQFEKKSVGKVLDKLIKKNKIDIIIAGQEAISTRFVSYATTNNKIAWVRCDYKRMLADTGKMREEYYNSYKAIICVSDQTCKNFKEIFPEYVSKTYCIPNPQDESLILNRADINETEPRFIKDGYTIISIGRLDKVKRFDCVAPIARKLRENGFHYRWYIIGDGDEWQNIADSISKYNVENQVIMLGSKTNPYYYIKRADALVCLSRSEACPRVINEAKILHTPTISTDFPTVYEFIENGKTGIISSLTEVPSAILRLFNDHELFAMIKKNINLFTFNNTELLERIEIIFS